MGIWNDPNPMRKLLWNLCATKHQASAIRKLKRMEYHLPSPEARFAIPFTYKGDGHFRSIRPRQTPSEIHALYAAIREVNPATVLEIGTAKGGTLYLWAQAATADALIVSVDLPGGQFGGGYLPCRVPLYQSFTQEGQTLKLLREDSHTPETLAKTKDALADRPVDFLFIDGDHLYPGVKQDFLQYGPLVRPGGKIGFHDIMPAPHDPDIQVDRLWKQLTQKFETTQFVDHDRTNRQIGIGLLTVPESGFPADLQLD